MLIEVGVIVRNPGVGGSHGKVKNGGDRVDKAAGDGKKAF